MRSLISSSLIMVIVAGSLIEFRDLPKIGLLINHYHQAHEQISLLEFLELHYGNGSEKHDKEHGHKSLPFKSHESTSVQFISFQPVVAVPSTSCIINSNKQEKTYRSVFISEFSQSIWQPPKL